MRLLLLLAILALVAGLLVRRRIRAAKDRRPEGLTDDMVRRIEREGRLRREEPEPLDLEEIREEEDAFWEQTWDEPEEL